MIAHSVEEPFYYLYNFQQVLDWVELRYADLLDEQERAFIRTFAELPRPARALLVRMVMRKGELFRTDKLQYAEIGCTHAALAPLLDTGWVGEQVELGVEQLFGLLRKDELARCFAGQLSRPKALKHELLAELLALELAPRTLASWFPTFPERVVQWRLQALCDRLRLLFFGNLYQDWSEFVLADLGFARYEQVAFSADSRALRSREDVTAAMALHACTEQLEQGATPQQVFAALPALAADNPWLARRRARLLFGLGQQCERLGDWEQATAIYAECQHPQARIRQVRVLERSEQWDAAHAFATQVAEAPANALEVQALERMLPRLARKLGGAPRSRRKAPAANLIHLVLPAEHAGLGVERAVGQYLHQEHGGQVHYVENTLFNGLFGLLCWEVIFSPVPGAFFHPFQSAPQDLHEADFQLRRAEAFEACFARLDAGTHAEVIRQVHQAKQGLQSPFVCWPALSPELLDQALGCLPPAHLKACFIRLLQDIRNNRTGMPDLIQFWPDEGRYRMIEVKGPGDRLQDNQLRWLEFCREHGLPVDVCHVRWDNAAS